MDEFNVLQDGLVAKSQAAKDRLGVMAMLRPTSLSEILAALDHYCRKSIKVSLLESQVIMGFEMPADIVARGREVSVPMKCPLFRYMFQVRPSDAPEISPTLQTKTLRSALQMATTVTEATEVISEALAEKVRGVLGLAQEQVSTDRPLASYGVDSLVGLELKHWLARETGASLNVFELLGGATLQHIGETAALESDWSIAQMGPGS